MTHDISTIFSSLFVYASFIRMLQLILGKYTQYGICSARMESFYTQTQEILWPICIDIAKYALWECVSIAWLLFFAGKLSKLKKKNERRYQICMSFVLVTFKLKIGLCSYYANCIEFMLFEMVLYVRKRCSQHDYDTQFNVWATHLVQHFTFDNEQKKHNCQHTHTHISSIETKLTRSQSIKTVLTMCRAILCTPVYTNATTYMMRKCAVYLWARVMNAFELKTTPLP